MADVLIPFFSNRYLKIDGWVIGFSCTLSAIWMRKNEDGEYINIKDALYDIRWKQIILFLREESFLRYLQFSYMILINNYE